MNHSDYTIEEQTKRFSKDKRNGKLYSNAFPTFRKYCSRWEPRSRKPCRRSEMKFYPVSKNYYKDAHSKKHMMDDKFLAEARRTKNIFAKYDVLTEQDSLSLEYQRKEEMRSKVNEDIDSDDSDDPFDGVFTTDDIFNIYVSVVDCACFK
jgi:hypothetical protein